MTRPPAVPEATGPGELTPDAPVRSMGGGHSTVQGRDAPTASTTARPRRSGRGGAHRGATARDTRLEQNLEALRDRIRAVEFADGLPGAEEGRTARSDVLDQLNDYVLPRVRRTDVPLLIAVAGSTGAGKSTLVNSLVGAQVTTTGVRRPTTNSPVLACNPADVDWFSEASFLPSLPRVRQQGLAMPGKDGMLVLAATEHMPEGVALLDTPDVDSVVAAHHEFAAKFLDAADLWVFVTTSKRYADARVWQFLQVARDRDTSLAVVLSRVPRRGRQQIVAHFGAMLEANGLGSAPRFVIPETDQIAGGRFTANTADQIRGYLADIAGDEVERERITRRTLLGVLDSFRTRIPELAKHVETQAEVGRVLATSASTAFAQAMAEVDRGTSDASLLRGNVLARWQDIAASGELARSLRIRNKRTRAQAEDRTRVRALEQAIQDAVEALVVSAAERAIETAMQHWRKIPGASAIAERHSLDRIPADFPYRARTAVADWQAHITELISSDGVVKRSVSRFFTYDVEAFGLVLIVGLLGFGISDHDSAAAPPPNAAPSRLLRALFGAEPLRVIGGRARDDLRARVSALFEAEKLRFAEALAETNLPDPAVAAQLYQANDHLEIAR
ncbi:GTPase [Thermobifida cellulosilytica]|uniref:ABC transporter n=1 Tax=Thermobifida cellulosilytica TB100 TaxID=665004 RepID=A0A147KH96_THECS|nr:GTPase [Thermobifida cellulosilytica]KUP96667.1 ABC transporter [Thermobifida cellulosilytica TB100]